MPTVSIIIATYNAEKTLRTALDSVFQQTFQDWECIIVDGASKDGTIDIIKEYTIKDSRFRYISEPDQGIYDAFNKGWKKAVGKWVFYLGSDDFLFCNGLAELIKVADDSDIVYGDCELRFKGGRKRRRGNLPLSCIDHCLPACHQSFIMKRSVIESLGGFNLTYRVYADLDLMQRAYIAGYKFAETNAIISSFFVGGVSSDNITAQMERYKLMRTNGLCKWPLLYTIRIMIKTALLKIKHLFA